MLTHGTHTEYSNDENQFAIELAIGETFKTLMYQMLSHCSQHYSVSVKHLSVTG